MKFVSLFEGSDYLVKFTTEEAAFAKDCAANDERIRAALNQLKQAIIDERCQSSELFWVIGKAKPEIAIETLTTLIADYGIEFDNETAYQAMIALDNCFAYHDERPSAQIAERLKASNVMHFVEGKISSDDPRLKESAQHVLDSLIEYVK